MFLFRREHSEISKFKPVLFKKNLRLVVKHWESIYFLFDFFQKDSKQNWIKIWSQIFAPNKSAAKKVASHPNNEPKQGKQQDEQERQQQEQEQEPNPL